MSATTRDTSESKDPQADASDCPASRRTSKRCPTTQPNDEPDRAPEGIAAALCRMALLRSRSLTVNGAYVSSPPADQAQAALD